MNEEFPHPGPAREDKDLDTERPVVPVPPAADTPPTGDERVDGAVAPLGRLAGLPAGEHVAVLEEVYGRLRDVLSDMDAAPDPEG